MDLKSLAGLMLQNGSKCFLNAKRDALLGYNSGASASHSGPLTEPNRIVSLDSHRDKVEGGRASPCRSIVKPPSRQNHMPDLKKISSERVEDFDRLLHDFRADTVPR